MRPAIVGAVLVAGAVLAAAALGLVDATAVSAKEAAIPAGNLVRNPGGEANVGGPYLTANIAPNGWTKGEGDRDTSPGIQVIRYGAHAYNPDKKVAAAIGGGSSFFAGGYPSRVSKSSQIVDLAAATSEIEAGGLKACLSAYLGGFRTQPGRAQVDVAFLGEDESPIGQRLRVGPVTRGHRRDATTLMRRAAEARVPAGTRKLHVEITAESGGGPTNYGWADNISVALTRGACEPVLAVRCVRGALLATVAPSATARTQRVRFQVRGAKGRKQVNDARAPYSARFPMAGLTGRLTVTATVSQAGSGPLVLTKRSRRC